MCQLYQTKVKVMLGQMFSLLFCTYSKSSRPIARFSRYLGQMLTSSRQRAEPMPQLYWWTTFYETLIFLRNFYTSLDYFQIWKTTALIQNLIFICQNYTYVLWHDFLLTTLLNKYRTILNNWNTNWRNWTIFRTTYYVKNTDLYLLYILYTAVSFNFEGIKFHGFTPSDNFGVF